MMGLADQVPRQEGGVVWKAGRQEGRLSGLRVGDR